MTGTYRPKIYDFVFHGERIKGNRYAVTSKLEDLANQSDDRVRKQEFLQYREFFVKERG